MSQLLRRHGLVVGVVAAALLVAALPGAAALLEYRRGALLAEPWRLITGQLTHWPGDHIVWDLGLFVALAPALAARSRGLLAATVAGALVLVPAALWVLQPGITSFRGLSGVDSALFGALAVVLLGELRGDRRGLWLLALQVFGFGAKLAWEAGTQSCLFVTADGWVPVPLAHVVGVLVGVAGAKLLGRGKLIPCPTS